MTSEIAETSPPSTRWRRQPKLKRTLPLALVVLSLGLFACGGEDDDDFAGTAPSPNTARDSTAAGGAAEKERQRSAGSGASKAPGTTIATGDSQFGEVLFGAEDRAIYVFGKESSDRSECYGHCAEAWPPVLTEGEPEAAGAAEARRLGTTERDDGTTQVTYRGQPLYYYVDDPRGEVLCHNVEEFGGLWLAVEPSGDAVQ